MSFALLGGVLPLSVRSVLRSSSTQKTESEWLVRAADLRVRVHEQVQRGFPANHHLPVHGQVSTSSLYNNFVYFLSFSFFILYLSFSLSPSICLMSVYQYNEVFKKVTVTYLYMVRALCLYLSIYVTTFISL